MPARSSAFLIAPIGATPMYSGSLPHVAAVMIRARGLRPSSAAFSALMSNDAAAPSLSGQALPAVTVPSSLNAGFSVASFSSVVPARGPSSLETTVPSSSVSGTISRSKNAGLLGRDGALLRALGVVVLLLARDAVALGDVLGGQAHRDVRVGLAGLLPWSFSFWSSGCAASCALVVARDELDAAGDVDVALARLDRVGGDADRVETRRAVARDRRAVGGLGRACRSAGPRSARCCWPAAPAAGRSRRSSSSTVGGIDARVALQQLVDDERERLVRAQRRERALEGAADRRPDGVDDDGFRH